MAKTTEAHGGELVDLLVSEKRAEELKKQSKDWPSWDLTMRQACDLELLSNGGFSPLTGFMNEDDYNSVVKDMRLADGTLWPIPITLDVNEEFAKSLKKGDKVALRDQEGVMLAALTVGDVWQPKKQIEAESVFGKDDKAHPAVSYLHDEAGDYYVGGEIEALQLPVHYDFNEMRLTPKELRERFAKRGWTKIVAFQTRNPMHRAHVEATLRAAKEVEANVLIHPVVGMTKPGDVDHATRIRIYQKIIDRYPKNTAMISLLPLAMRMGGPREAVWHAIIRKNYGMSHFITGRDHAGPGKDSDGEDFYDPFAARDLALEHAEEIGIGIVNAGLLAYIKNLDKYLEASEVEEGMEVLSISGTQLRERLKDGRELPEWFTYPEVAEELRKTHPPRHRQGYTVFFTGLSGSGKSTIANALLVKLQAMGGRPITLLDGDVVRKHLSSELGFSKEDRDTNIRRIGYVASEISKHRGVALCAPIAPYDNVRKDVREMVEGKGGGFILAHVATPLEVCEERDRKGLYAKARAGVIKEFTGISDPYEEPADAEIVLDTVKYSAEELAQQVLLYLEKEGFIAGEERP